MSKRLAFLFLFLITGLPILLSQSPCPPQFNNAPSCGAACVTCNIDDMSSSGSFGLWPTQSIASCGTGAPFTIDRPSWHAFVAGSMSITFEIRWNQCQNNAGIEAAIFGSCQANLNGELTALTCASGGNPVNFSVNGLTVGQTYYLLVDGINGDVCKYTVNVVIGSAKAPELGPMSDIMGPTQVCPKAKVNYILPYVENAQTYTWTAPAGSKINGGTNVLQLPATGLTSTVEIEFGPVGGAVCVTAATPCDTPITKCIQVVNQAIPITQLDDLTLCFEELPYFWPEQPGYFISAPGTYTFTSTPYTSYLGCDSLVRQKIVAKPRNFKVLPPKYLCNDECFTIGGFQYCESGNYTEALPAADGCDSLLNFTLVKIRANASVKKPDTLTCRFPTTVLMADSTTTTGNTVKYAWVNAQGDTLSTGLSATVNNAGPFYFIVNNIGGGIVCADTAIVNVPVNKTLPIANAGPNRVLTCDEPVIQLQGSGSSGPNFTYLWLAFNGGNIVSGANTLTPLVNATGTYRLRVTNQHNGCTQTDNTIVTADVIPPTLSATGGTFDCIETMVQLQTTTNAAGPTYAWTGPNNFTSSSPNPLVGVAGEYTVVVTDSITGCTNSALAVVVANINPPGAMAMGGVLTCVADTVALSGNSPATNPAYAWTGPNGFSSNQQNPVVSAPGNYALTVTGTNGCTSTATAVVLRDTVPPGATLAVSSNLNCNNATVNLTATSMAPAASLNHTWTRPNGSSSSTGTNPVFVADTAGLYTVVITNTENGCTSSTTASVVRSPAVTASISAVQNVRCFGQQNGSATAAGSGGNGMFTYTWNTGDDTPVNTGLSAGSYTVTVTDGEQCTATATVSITQPSVLAANVSATPQMANGAADGTASANPSGGTPGYTYNWSNNETTATISDLLPGTYTVTVTDTNGCTAVAIANVSQYNCTIDAAIEAANASCFEANDGTATAIILNGVAPFTYLWSTGDTTVSVSGLAPGVYSVVVTDAADCPQTIGFTISEPAILRANATAVNMTGPVTNDGMASSSPTGGTPPYTFAWSTGDTTATIDSLAAGTYTITVTDINGCSVVRMVEVLAGNCGIVVNFISAPAKCTGEATGAATAVLNGGTGPFSYEWSSGGTAETEENLAAGAYTVTVTDANDCTLTAQVTITEPPLLTLELDTVINTACPDLPEGSATVIAGGGTGNLSIQWSNGQTGPTADNLIAGTYTVSVTDGNDCQTSLQATVEAIDLEPPVIASDSVVGPLGMAGNITLSVMSLGLDVSDNCGIKEVKFVPASFNCAQLGPHQVVVTATDIAGNVTVDTIIVTVVDQLPPTLVCPPSVVRCAGDDIVQYAAPVATDNCLGNGGMFALVSGLPSGASFPEGTTTNTYTYTDADGNIGSCTFEVTVLTPLQLQLDTILPDKGGLEIGGIFITVSGSLSPYTFEWFRNGDPFLTTMEEDLDSIGHGSYTVLITDEVGCMFEGGPFVVDSLVSTNTPTWASGLLIMPNPTRGQLAVVFPEQLKEDVHFTIFDMTGRLVLRQVEYGPKQVDFDLGSMPQGIYTVLIRVDRQILARKIVVSR